MENENKQNQSSNASNNNSNTGSGSGAGSNSNSGSNSGSGNNASSSGNSNSGGNAGNSGSSSNSGKSSDSGSNSNSGQKKPSGAEASVLTLLQPHDMSRTVESALHVFQGKHDKLPDLMQDIGNIVLRATKRFSTTQLVVAAGALTIGAILLAKYSEDMDFDFDN